MGPPRVTVLMPVWNGGAHLPAAIRSVLGQTLVDRELLVVDDGSTDDSVAVARASHRASLERVACCELLVAMRLVDREELARLEAWLAQVA